MVVLVEDESLFIIYSCCNSTLSLLVDTAELQHQLLGQVMAIIFQVERKKKMMMMMMMMRSSAELLCASLNLHVVV